MNILQDIIPFEYMICSLASHIWRLYCTNCPNIRTIQSMPDLSDLDCSNCLNLETISSMPELRKLECRWCPTLGPIYKLLFPTLEYYNNLPIKK